ncbi:hypothetical protein Q4489_14775 [Thalassotalea sp. 1_MG-2023]|uniref:hypothetical protein n=1 Tax=Thalassotalea sp. 1_MG-2023 TaxID=3062680 RepID=UPI0026E23D73|nr:hypothetical protein [Thalassotalea sp. 1_MG-2023]MDO6428282.1 hypothetical protein [Thalassotalea sp. 1_MG-2023]
MFTQYIKSILSFHRAQPKAPNFFLVYALIWLALHNQFFVTFISTSGSLNSKISAATASIEHQYLLSLLFTITFFALRLTYLYFVTKANEIADEDAPIEDKLGHDQVFTENKDVMRLVVLLDETKAKLASANKKETELLEEKQAVIQKSRELQTELEEVKADLAIMTQQNEVLKSELTRTA